MKFLYWIDSLLWKMPAYRRHEMRKRLRVEVVAIPSAACVAAYQDKLRPVCAMCGTTSGVVSLNNGTRACMACREFSAAFKGVHPEAL